MARVLGRLKGNRAMQLYTDQWLSWASARGKTLVATFPSTPAQSVYNLERPILARLPLKRFPPNRLRGPVHNKCKNI
jgi:hypothetical protein